MDVQVSFQCFTMRSFVESISSGRFIPLVIEKYVQDNLAGASSHNGLEALYWDRCIWC